MATVDRSLQLSAHFTLGEFLSPNDPWAESHFLSSPVTYTARLKKLCGALEQVRAHFGNKAITINSGLRSPQHNKQIGGAQASQHMVGQAADFTVEGVDPHTVADYCYTLSDLGGVGRYATWTHADVRQRDVDGQQARWEG